MQREQHVGVASLVLICIRSAGAACGDGCIQEECSFLSRRSTQLALILKLPGGGAENRVRVSKGDHIGPEKEDRCEKDTRKERKEREGSLLIGLRHTFLAH